jgi:hypothetical protein
VLTIAIWWIASSYVLAVVLAADQLRRPLPAWEAIGASRRFWVSLTLVLGFHGLGPYVAAAYLGAVRPRFGGRPPRPRRSRARLSAGRPASAAQQFASVAALLVLVSSVIHAAVVADHFEEYWAFGVLFAAAACAQAAWVGLIYAGRLSRPVLLAGAATNAGLVAVWALSRTAGLPLGPHPWTPEAVGTLDVLATLDELAAVVLVGAALACLRRDRAALTSPYLRLVALTGPLFIYSFMAAFGGAHHH